MKNMVMYKRGEASWITYIKARIRQNLNFMAIAEGQTGCLSKDTILKGQTKGLGNLFLAGQRVIDTISIVKNSSGEGWRLKKSKSEIINSGFKDLYEIELEDGRKVLATEKHKLFKVEGVTFKRELVSNLKVGNVLKTYPSDYVDNFYNGANERQKKVTRQKIPKYVCKKCNNLIFLKDFYKGCGGEKVCDYCKSLEVYPKNKNRNLWYEWEDNLLRQFYYNMEKSKLQELLPKRNWSGIMKRARRLGVKKKKELQWEQNAWTTENNPIHNPKSREKMIKNKQKAIYKRNQMTSIEKKVAEFLTEKKIPFEFNKVVRTKSTFRFPDFRIKGRNLLIECDGSYWHNMRKEEDAKRQKELEEEGFEFLRFSDTEINNDWESVEQCIKQKLSQ